MAGHPFSRNYQQKKLVNNNPAGWHVILSRKRILAKEPEKKLVLSNPAGWHVILSSGRNRGNLY